jgi:hypothetical protein
LQVNKFANFFLSQKHSYHTLSDALALVDGLTAAADNTIAVPLAAVLKQKVLTQSSSASGLLTLTLTDIFGRFVTAAKV